MGVAYNEGEGNFQKAKEQIQAILEKGVALSECGICGSKELHYEDAATKFKTMQEAIPALADTMVDQIATRRKLDEAGLTCRKLPTDIPNLNRPDLN